MDCYPTCVRVARALEKVLPCDEKERLLEESSALTRQLHLAKMESLYSNLRANGPSQQLLGERIDELERAVVRAHAGFARHVAEHGCGSGPGARF